MSELSGSDSPHLPVTTQVPGLTDLLLEDTASTKFSLIYHSLHPLTHNKVCNSDLAMLDTFD